MPRRPARGRGKRSAPRRQPPRRRGRGTPVAMTIAGSDPSGGAGIQADLKTFHQHGVYGTSVITLLTVQNTRGVQDVRVLEPDFVVAQMEAVLGDLEPAAAKTGALGSQAVVKVVAARAASFRFPLVVDPVMISKHGAPLLDAEGRRALVEDLLPRAFLVTPNLPEAAELAGIEIRDQESLREAARRISGRGPKAVLIKGGHRPLWREGERPLGGGRAVDLLLVGGRFHELAAPRLPTDHTHGTGCTFSAAIVAQLARGRALLPAVSFAKRYITRAIRTSPGLGHGFGPVNHRAPVA